MSLKPLGAHVDTFRPGDLVQLVDLIPNMPAYLVGVIGTIRTMSEGRGRNRGRWYADVLFTTSTKPRRVPLRALKRA